MLSKVREPAMEAVRGTGIVAPQGIAGELLGLVGARAREAQALAVYLHVAAYNAAAVAFYVRHGFRRAALLRAFYSIT